MGNFSDLKREMLAPAIVEHLGDEVRHETRLGASQASGLSISFHNRPELDEEGSRWKYGTGETAQFYDMPVRGDIIEIIDTGERFTVNRAVDNGGILELRLEATTR